MTTPAILGEAPDFSLVLGGPVYQLCQRAYLSGPTLELLPRRVLFFALFTWLPLFLLSAFGGQLQSNGQLGFLRDIETHVKFLVALPALIIAELVVHRRVRSAVKHFVQRRIVTSEDVPRFYGTDKPTSYPLPRHFSTPPAPAIPLPRLFTAQ